MRSREADVSETHDQTYQWIFSESQSSTSALFTASDFVNWLRKESGLFWISGKAGSGKSTLMKFVFEHPRTHSELSVWTGRGKLVVSRHFFWNSGTPLQKSDQGLLRSLCYDIFRTCPDLLPVVCRKRWNLLEPTGCFSFDTAQLEEWSTSELYKAISQIGESNLKSDGRKIHFCFLIDGLRRIRRTP